MLSYSFLSSLFSSFPRLFSLNLFSQFFIAFSCSNTLPPPFHHLLFHFFILLLLLQSSTIFFLSSIHFPHAMLLPRNPASITTPLTASRPKRVRYLCPKIIQVFVFLRYPWLTAAPLFRSHFFDPSCKFPCELLFFDGKEVGWWKDCVYSFFL